MADVAFVAAGTVGYPGFAIAAGAVTGIADADISIFHIIGRNNAAHSFSANGTGWTNFLEYLTATDSVRTSAWWQRRSGAYTVPTVTSTGQDQGSISYITAWRNCATSVTPTDVLGGETYTAATAATLVVPGISGLAAGSMYIAFYASRWQNDNYSVAGGLATRATGAGFGNTNGGHSGSGEAYKVYSSGGATGSGSFTVNAQAYAVAVYEYSLRNEPAGGATAYRRGSSAKCLGRRVG
jgi:hypothetical protein